VTKVFHESPYKSVYNQSSDEGISIIMKIYQFACFVLPALVNCMYFTSKNMHTLYYWSVWPLL